MTHFVVLKRVRRDGGIDVHDPARGPHRLTRGRGVAALHRRRAGDHADRGFPARRPAWYASELTDLSARARGSLSPLVQTLVLSLILQAYVLAAPFYMQLAVDEAVVKDDRSLLGVLAVGFGLAMLFNAGAGLLRSRMLVYLQSRFAFDLGNGLFRHLLKLPLPFFERRHIGDLVSRFGSIEPIRNLLAEGLITALVDGAMAVLTAGMVFLYSVRLGTGGGRRHAGLRDAARGVLSGVPRSARSISCMPARARTRASSRRRGPSRASRSSIARVARNTRVVRPLRGRDRRQRQGRMAEGRLQGDQRRGVRSGESRGDLSRRARRARQPHDHRHAVRLHRLQAAVHRQGDAAGREGDRVPAAPH